MVHKQLEQEVTMALPVLTWEGLRRSCQGVALLLLMRAMTTQGRIAAGIRFLLEPEPIVLISKCGHESRRPWRRRWSKVVAETFTW